MTLLLNKYFIGSVVGIVLLFFIGYKIYDFGYTNATSTVAAEYEKIISDINEKTATELARQNEITEKLNKLQNQKISDLQAKNEEIDRIQKENEIDASKDPRANDIAISPDGVLRINRVR